jgi:hypothetical protein
VISDTADAFISAELICGIGHGAAAGLAIVRGRPKGDAAVMKTALALMTVAFTGIMAIAIFGSTMV